MLRFFCLCTLLLSAGFARAQQPCDFPPVKQQIDLVLEQNAEQFRREVRDGWDSIEVLNRMVSEDIRRKIDACRFYVAEYLTKRGFPPAH